MQKWQTYKTQVKYAGMQYALEFIVHFARRAAEVLLRNIAE
jgi:Zn-dependent M32 family carboxypeptidase